MRSKFLIKAFASVYLALLTHSSCAGQDLPMKQLVDRLGVLWQNEDCDSICNELTALEDREPNEPAVWVLRMSEALVCERSAARFEEARLAFIGSLKKISRGDEIRRFVFENAGFDSWLNVVSDPSGFDQIAKMNRAVRKNRFPGGEVALWVFDQGD